MEGISGNNVYILGAGFSKPYGHPLMATFIKDGYKAILGSQEQKHNWDFTQRVMDGIKLVENHYDGYFSKTYDTGNIEELLRIVSNFGDDNQNLCEKINSVIFESLKKQLVSFIILTLECTRLPFKDVPSLRFDEREDYLRTLSRFNPNVIVADFPTRKFMKSSYESGKLRYPYPEMFIFLSALGDPDNPDIIMSFNYDLVLEEVLEKKLLNTFSYEYPQIGSTKIGKGNYTLKIYKPNGSANWLQCEKCRRFSVAPGYAYPKDECDYGDCRNGKMLPFIRPPGAKEYKDEGNMISTIKELIRKAEKVGIFGFSFPRTDKPIFDAFLRGMREADVKPEILVFNPDYDLQNREESCFSDLKEEEKTLAKHFNFNPFDIQRSEFHRYEAQNLFASSIRNELRMIAERFNRELPNIE